jgi:hypothetical protein
MAETQLTYGTGVAVADGDWVRIEAGKTVGRVSSVLNTMEQAKSRGLEARGVVIDAQPKGLVFLSEQYLLDDPLQFIRRGPGEVARFGLTTALAFSVLLLLPALYSFFSALYSAATTGHVTVISLGYSHTHRESVPWQVGWARFVSPAILLLALVTFDGSRGSTLRWWLSGAAAAIGLTLLCFSAWFTALGKAAFLLAFVSVLFLAIFIDRKLGRGVAFLFLLACVLGLVWRFARAI